MMSLPFLSLAIFVNWWAMIWWWPHFFGSFSLRQIKSCQISFTKYKKLSWHSLTCSIHFFSTWSLSFSIGKLEVIFILEFCAVYTFIYLNTRSRRRNASCRFERQRVIMFKIYSWVFCWYLYWIPTPLICRLPFWQAAILAGGHFVTMTFCHLANKSRTNK